MVRIASLVKVALALAILAPALVVAPPARANNTGAFIGGLVGGAILGSALTAATRPPPPPRYYYPPPPPPPPPAYYRPAPVYGPGYCGAPPYPPCRTPVY